MPTSPVVAILGASHSGFGLAADLALRGQPVRLYDLPEFADALAPVTARGGIELTGVRGSGFASVPTTLDPAAAVRDAALILCTVPAYGHAAMLAAVLPYLARATLLVMTGGAPFSALPAAAQLAAAGRSDVIVAETSNFIFACTKSGPAAVHIAGSKLEVPTATLPATAMPALARLQAIYPEHVAADSVLATSLSNVNLSLHPAMLLCNAGRIETFGGGWPYFVEGLTPSVARLVETLDAERLAITGRFGLPRISSREWLARAYADRGFAGANLFKAFQTSPVFQKSASPATLAHRHFLEDVPFGLVPMVSLGQSLGLPMTVSRGVVAIAGALLGRDFMAEGRTIASLGLAGMTPEAIVHYVTQGH
jgi:opine dehydrogenase